MGRIANFDPDLIAEENIYVQIITYSCLASHDKRQEAQQLKGGEKITSFHEDQVF